MLQRQEKRLRSLVMRQCIKKIVCLVVLALGISTNLSSCSSAKLSEAQIDTVEIYVSHYASGTVEKTLTEKDMVNKYVVFFDGLDLQEKSEDVVVSELDGGGWDCVSFKSQDKIIKQYVIYGDEFICEDESLIHDIINEQNVREKLDSYKWHVISDEDHTEWQTYKQALKQ